MSVALVVALAVVAGIAALVTTWWNMDRRQDLGAVSHQWIAEHRFGTGQDSGR